MVGFEKKSNSRKKKRAVFKTIIRSQSTLERKIPANVSCILNESANGIVGIIPHRDGIGGCFVKPFKIVITPKLPFGVFIPVKIV